ncbi:MAG: hypothetical protein K9G64_04010 [Bacteroidia bacterium]|nr:hypothetical protein [Bacteroidia bacterium]
MIDWVKVTEVNSVFTAQNIIAFLADNEIEASDINKTDSSYAGAFGKVEIYCHQENAVAALHLIEKNNF